MPRRGSSKPPAEPVVKPYGCDLILTILTIMLNGKVIIDNLIQRFILIGFTSGIQQNIKNATNKYLKIMVKDLIVKMLVVFVNFYQCILIKKLN